MPSFNKEKFKEVLHYIIHECEGFDNIGKTVVYKLLYFSDFDFYEEFETHLTGETYYRLPHGPAPIHFDKIIGELKEEGLVRQIRTSYYGKTQNKYISLKKPTVPKLNHKEISVIDKAILKLCNMSATQVSAYSHLDMPWKAAKKNDKLDYELVFYRDDVMSVRENQHA